MTLFDPRFITMCRWLAQEMSIYEKPALLMGDASMRRYFRVSVQGKPYIVMDSPPELFDVSPFISVANALSEAGVKVPEIIGESRTEGFVLLTDLGDGVLLSLLTKINVKAHYANALAILQDVAKVKHTMAGPLPSFDGDFVKRELDIFTRWLLNEHLQLTLNVQTQELLQQVFCLLVSNALEQPVVGMHRDFHSRNLMEHNGHLYVLDFQDAVQGPITYDSVSLLKDCYVRWPEPLVKELMWLHYQGCQDSGLLSEGVSFEQYCLWFDLMGLQRHLKAVGIFARLNYRDNKPGYMKDIPLTMTYIVEVANRYPQLSEFASWLQGTLIPALEAKSCKP